MRLALLVSLGLVLVTARTAQGRMLHTPPLAREVEGVLACRAANDARQPQTLRVQAFDGSGAETLDTGHFLLAPGAVFLSGAGGQARSCRFSVAGDGVGLRASGMLSTDDAWRSLDAHPDTAKHAAE